MFRVLGLLGINVNLGLKPKAWCLAPVGCCGCITIYPHPLLQPDHVSPWP